MAKLVSSLLYLLIQTQSHCPVTYSFYSDTNTLVQRSPTAYSPSALLSTIPPVWTSILGAHWIWESNALTQGTFTFVRTFVLAEWARVALTSVRLSIAADGSFAVRFNGQPVTLQWSGGFGGVTQYELKAWVLGSDGGLGVQENTLEMTVMNTNANGGIVYRLDLS